LLREDASAALQLYLFLIRECPDVLEFEQQREYYLAQYLHNATLLG
jgi:hypothetical protein